MKLKTLFIFSLIVLLACEGVESQSMVSVQELTWEQALKEAQKRCDPCKQIDKEVFTNGDVAELFNKSFVNAKYDMEKGQGPELKEKYNVKCFSNILVSRWGWQSYTPR